MMHRASARLGAAAADYKHTVSKQLSEIIGKNHFLFFNVFITFFQPDLMEWYMNSTPLLTLSAFYEF